MSPISPPRALNGTASPHALSASSLRQQQQQEFQSPPPAQPPALTDFPPLTLTAPEKPRVAGAWTNSSSARAIVMTPAQAQAGGSALVTHHVGESPKPVRRPTTGRSEGSVNGTGGSAGPSSAGVKEKERARGDVVASAILVSQVAGLTLEERLGADGPAAPSAPGMLPTKDPAALAVSI
jgi:hypothetical protein